MAFNRVFLGGTCNESVWRQALIPLLRVAYFNPVVEDWTLEAQQLEVEEREERCNIHLYVITSEMTGVFSIAEVIDSVYQSKVRTIFQVIPSVFNEGQLRSLKAVVDLVNRRGGIAYVHCDIEKAARIINNCFEE